MTSRVQTFIAEEVPALQPNEIPMPHWAYGAIAFFVFLLMFGILWSFRNTAPKLGEQVSHDDVHVTNRDERSDH